MELQFTIKPFNTVLQVACISILDIAVGFDYLRRKLCGTWCRRNNNHVSFCLTDIDECAAPVDPCNAVANSACNNTYGSYICQCIDGFIKNGANCEGVI